MLSGGIAAEIAAIAARLQSHVCVQPLLHRAAPILKPCNQEVAYSRWYTRAGGIAAIAVH